MKNKNKKSTKKVILLGAIALVGFGSVGATFAYWASSVTGSNSDISNDVNIGSGKEEGTTVTIGGVNSDLAGKKLVPVTRATASDEVEKVVVSFDISWASIHTDATKGTKGTLTPSLKDVKNSTATDVSKYIAVSFDAASYDIVSDGAAVKVTATISLNEPANATEYALVANQVFSLNFNFDVVVVK